MKSFGWTLFYILGSFLIWAFAYNLFSGFTEKATVPEAYGIGLFFGILGTLFTVNAFMALKEKDSPVVDKKSKVRE